MFSRYSVKKPLTVVLAALMVVLLGVISFTKMRTDLLPEMDLPYVAVVTVYAGASPEKVETGVTKPLESALSTVSGVHTVTSISQENTSMVIFEFEYGTNMDRAVIDMNNKMGTATASMDDAVGTPILMQINPDMLPVMIASVDVEGKSSKDITPLVSETVVPAFERLNGVASVEAMGLIERQLKVSLSQQKIDALNDRILEAVDQKLAEAQEQLREGETALEEARAAFEKESAAKTEELTKAGLELEQGKNQLQQGLSTIAAGLLTAESSKTQLSALREAAADLMGNLSQSGTELLGPLGELLEKAQALGVLTPEQADAILAGLDGTAGDIRGSVEELLAKLDGAIEEADAGIAEAKARQAELSAGLDEILNGEQQLEQGKIALSTGLADAKRQIEENAAALEQARATFESSRDTALEQAGVDGLVTMQTVNTLLAANNFSMPAGSLAEDGGAVPVKVGDLFSSVDEAEQMPLFSVSAGEIGTIRLSDVADVFETDNAGETYAKINGNDGVLLTMQKQSTASTTEVSDLIRETMAELEAAESGLHLTALNDQGQYIHIVVGSVLQNLLMGGALAIVILFFFLRSVKPTFMVAVSIPLSLVLAVVLMYFSGVTLNVISLAGLALGVGMLVDNSIVVIENIYRLRAQGMSAANAAVKGASQVAGAIASSTLTTICVFLPLVFTEGISRQLFTDMGLTIAYSLMASLLIALTLVPSLSSLLLGRVKQKPEGLFGKFVSGYARSLSFTLRHKAPVLIGAAVLLGVSVFGVTRMGTAFMPDTDSNQISVSLTTPDGTSAAETQAISDQVIGRIQGIEGVQTVGAMQGGDQAVTMYVLLTDGKRGTSQEISRRIVEETADMGCEITASGSGMDISAMAGSGLQIDITGDDLDTLRRIAGDIAALVEGTPGTAEISDGMDKTSPEIRITVDKEKAAAYNLTVAQVYQSIAGALQTESTATTLSADAGGMPVVVVRAEEDQLNRDGLLAFPLTGKTDEGEVSVTLGDIARVEDAEGLQSIRHSDRVRTLSVTAEIDPDHNIGLVSREVQKKLDGYTVPEGYRVTLTGENETINSTLRDLVLMVLLALVLIYAIMAAQFQSLLSPFIVMFTIPLAFTGGLLALWILGFDLSVVAMLGFLVLSGVVVNNGIVFVDSVNQLRLEGMEKRDAIVETGRRRIRPILMTALTTILGLFTTALAVGQGADLLQPMAVVIIAGLAYATLLTLFIVPALYDIFRRKELKRVELDDDRPDASDPAPQQP